MKIEIVVEGNKVNIISRDESFIFSLSLLNYKIELNEIMVDIKDMKEGVNIECR